MTLIDADMPAARGNGGSPALEVANADGRAGNPRALTAAPTSGALERR